MAPPAAVATPVPFAALMAEAARVGFVALLLLLPLIGLLATEGGGGLVIVTRFDLLLLGVALVFLGRLGLSLAESGQHGPALAAGLAATLAGLLLPLPAAFLSVALVLGGAVLAVRAGWLFCRTGAVAPPLAGGLVLVTIGVGAGLDLWPGPLAGEDAPVLGAALALGGLVLAGRALAGGPLRRTASTPVLPQRDRVVWLIAAAAIVFALLLPWLPFADRRWLDIGILILTYVMLGWGLNIVVGLAGLLDLGFVAFYAIGAYSYALLAVGWGWSFWVCLPLAGVLAALGGLLLGFPVLKLRGDYFAIVTLGFGEIIRLVLINWREFTGGPDGITGIPRPSFFGLAEFERRPEEGMVAFHQLFGLEFDSLHRIIFLYYLILVLALLLNVFSLRIRRLPIGQAWEALREDDIACQALGINRVNIKLAAFMISAAWGGFAGAFFATRQGFISPESFTFLESAIILAIVVLGGLGSQLGVVLATFVLIGLPEIFRDLQEYRMLAFGAGMVAIMTWRPRGLLSHRTPTVRLAQAGEVGG